MNDKPVDNGWFVNDDHLIFAIINGSAYEVNAEGTPLAKLEPGSYTDAQAQSALAKLEDKYAESKA